MADFSSPNNRNKKFEEETSRIEERCQLQVAGILMGWEEHRFHPWELLASNFFEVNKEEDELKNKKEKRKKISFW